MKFLGILGVVFVTLKLTHYIDWSWVWVLAPFWIAFLLWITIMTISVLIVWKQDEISDWVWKWELKKMKAKKKISDKKNKSS